MLGPLTPWTMTLIAALPTGIVFAMLIQMALNNAADSGGINLLTETGVGMGFAVVAHLLIHSAVTVAMGLVVFHWQLSAMADQIVLPLLTFGAFVPFCLDILCYVRANRRSNRTLVAQH